MACIRPVSSETADAKNQKSIIEIYTDWANHYLDKTKGRKKITNLQAELADGVVLCEVIEAVTQQKVPDVNKKPKTVTTMVTNIQACLNFLRAKGVAVDDIRPEDIREGNLKAILGLFFQLSRYKQQQKQLGGQQQQRGSVPNSPAKMSSIPVPGSCVSPRRGDGKKSADVPGPRGFLNGKSNNTQADKQGIKPPSGKPHGGMQPVGVNGNDSGIPAKQSMLDRLKAGRSSHIPGSAGKPGLGKRTSSSSGFSSARSDRSESSISLSSDTNFPSPSALRRIQENQEILQHADQARRPGVKNRLTRNQGAKDKSCSPKRSPKLGRSSGPTEIKDYGPIDDGGRVYPPHAYSRSNSGISFKHTNITSSEASRRGSGGGGDPSSRLVNPAHVHPAQAKTSTKVGGSGIPGPGCMQNRSGGIPGPGKLHNRSGSGGGQVKQTGGKPPPVPPLRTASIAAKEAVQPEEINKPDEKVQDQLTSAVCSGEATKDDSDKNGVASEPTALPPSNKTCSLPRQKRRGDMSPSPNVAIVSPMPAQRRLESPRPSEELKKEESEDPLHGISPMAPLGLFRGRNVAEPRVREIGNMQTVNSALITGDPGYVSDSDVSRHRGKMDSGYISEGGADCFVRRRSKAEDGYASEGGAEFYSKKMEQRLAYERQREEAELQHKRYLQAAGKGGKTAQMNQMIVQQGAEQVYKVVGGRRNVQKADSGMQTEIVDQQRKGGSENGKVVLTGKQEKEEWRAAMERSKRMLTSQEQAMEEYLRRQRKEAEKHIKNSPMLARRKGHDTHTHPGRQGGIMSMPGTPTGLRRSGSRQQRSLVTPEPPGLGRFSRGGSLERRFQHVPGVSSAYDTVSDSEYVQNGFRSGSPRENSKSLPKGTSSLNYGLLVGQIQQKRQHRPNNDGTMSDSNYATYSELTETRGAQYQWMQPANTYSGWSNNEDMGSRESINSISSSIKNARSLSLTKANVMAHQMEAQKNYSTNFPRSRGFSRMSNQEDTEYYGVPIFNKPNANGSRFNSQPSSPVYGDKSIAKEIAAKGPSPLKYSSLPSYSSSSRMKHKNSLGETRETLNGSNLSLASNSSSVYSTQEEKTNSDIAKLQRELVEEQSKVFSLTNQLNTNAHVVSAFEQSLANMTSRLQQITKTAERKDAELAELRRTMEALRQSGVDAGLIGESKEKGYANELSRQMSTDSVTSIASNSGDERERSRKTQPSGPKRSGWLRNSFSKAFSRSKSRSKGGSVSDCDDGSGRQDKYEDPTDAEPDPAPVEQPSAGLHTSNSSSSLVEDVDPTLVDDLKRQLIEKDSLLTETRLEALSSAHQLESLKDTVTKMKTELLSLRQDNEKLQIQVVNKSLGSSESSLNTSNDQDPDRRLSLAMSEASMMSGPSTLDLSGTTDPSNQDSKQVTVEVELSESPAKEITRIGIIAANGKLSWQLLDSLIERLFKEFIMRIDPVTHLGLGADSIQFYQVGEISRTVHSPNPELLPYGYLVGDINSIKIVLKNSKEGGGVDALAFETLTPKSIMQRYVSLLQEHRRVILSGPSSTGKSFIAGKLANFLVKTCARGKPRTVETFALQRGNLHLLQEFLDQVNSQVESHAEQTPYVIILDNLQFAQELDELLCKHLKGGPESFPFIIGTMVQTSGAASATNLQLKHSFRWILCANHIEPVRGFLSRCLRRKLLEVEVDTKVHNPDCSRIIDWVCKTFLGINKFLETHSNPDATLSPGVYLDCPIHPADSKLWFINLWNLSIVPHVLDSVREGLQMYGKRAAWEDPLKQLVETWPWPNLCQDKDNLVHIRPEDVGFDTSQPLRPLSGNLGENQVLEDPLFNMLMTLQEAANTETGDL